MCACRDVSGIVDIQSWCGFKPVCTNARASVDILGASIDQSHFTDIHVIFEAIGRCYLSP